MREILNRATSKGICGNEVHVCAHKFSCITVLGFITSQPIRQNRRCTHVRAHAHTHAVIGREIIKYTPLLLKELIMHVGHLLLWFTLLIAGGGHLSLINHKRAIV